MADLYGTDILMSNDGDLQASPGGDLATVTDVANLNQAVNNRLLTEPDEYFFSDYGTTLKQYVDSVDPMVTTNIQQDVPASLLNDPRISSASANATFIQNSDGSHSLAVQATVVSAFGDASSVGVVV